MQVSISVEFRVILICRNMNVRIRIAHTSCCKSSGKIKFTKIRGESATVANLSLSSGCSVKSRKSYVSVTSQKCVLTGFSIDGPRFGMLYCRFDQNRVFPIRSSRPFPFCSGTPHEGIAFNDPHEGNVRNHPYVGIKGIRGKCSLDKTIRIRTTYVGNEQPKGVTHYGS